MKGPVFGQSQYSSRPVLTPNLVNRQLQHYEETLAYPLDDFGVVPHKGM